MSKIPIIPNFDSEKYENAKSYLLKFASDDFIEKTLMLNRIIESVVDMEHLLKIMRGLYVQLKRQK